MTTDIKAAYAERMRNGTDHICQLIEQRKANGFDYIEVKLLSWRLEQFREAGYRIEEVNNGLLDFAFICWGDTIPRGITDWREALPFSKHKKHFEE